MSRGWATFLIFVLAFPAGAWTAFVAQRLWLWFAVSAGAPPVSLVRMMGVGVLISMYRIHPATDPRAKHVGGEEMFKDYLVRAALLPAISLLIGWLYAALL